MTDPGVAPAPPAVAPSPAPRRRVVPVAAAVLAVALAALFRLAVVRAGASGSPDAMQYHALAQELVTHHRLAFAPPPLPVTHSRLPGYPLIAAVIDGGPLPFDAHLRRAVVWNVLFDLLTAACVLAILRARARRAAGWVAFALVTLCPLLFALSAYPLTEPLATLLSTAALWLALRPAPRRPLREAAAVGVLAGLGLLTRLDVGTLIPALGIALWWGAPALARRMRIRRVAVALAALVVVYAPWPIRNVVQFGTPHFAGTELPAQDGRALPATGFMRWMRTWSTARPGEAHLANLLVFGHRFSSSTPWAVQGRMFDSPEEGAELRALVDRVGREGLTESTDAGFDALASRRWRAHPLRTGVLLPLERLGRLFAPPPRSELPLRVPFLGLPQAWWLFGLANAIAYLGAAIGALLLFAGRARVLVVVLLLAVAGRAALHAFAVPHFVSQRYLAEALPPLLALAAVALTMPFELRRRRRAA